jgi:hypothetical protein
LTDKRVGFVVGLLEEGRAGKDLTLLRDAEFKSRWALSLSQQAADGPGVRPDGVCVT